MSIRDDFSERLKALRKEIGISQETFAEALGVARATLGYYEKGDRLPDIEFLDLVCGTTGCSLEYLMGRRNNMNPSYSTFGGETGLSDKAIDALTHVKESAGSETLNHLIEHPNFSALLLAMRMQSFCLKGKEDDFPNGSYREYKLFQASEIMREICQSMKEPKSELVVFDEKGDLDLVSDQHIIENEKQRLLLTDAAILRKLDHTSRKADLDARSAQKEEEFFERAEIDPVTRFYFRMARKYSDEMRAAHEARES